MQNTNNAISESGKMLKDQIVILIVQTNMSKLHIKVNGRNLSIGMTFFESRAGWALTPDRRLLTSDQR